MMNGIVCGSIAAKVELQKKIAKRRRGCRIVVRLEPISKAEGGRRDGVPKVA
jgi:hypothetical protein